MKKELYFKVKYGYNSSDSVSIPEGELAKAIYAQLKGIPVQLGTSFINGKNIISIAPNYNRYTGWNDSYSPQDASDYAQIKRDCPNFDGVMERYKNKVAQMIANRQEIELTKGPLLIGA